MSLNKRIDPKNMSNNELDNYLLKNSTFFKTENKDKNNIKKNITNPIRTNTNSLEITNSQNSNNFLNNINTNNNNNNNEINYDSNNPYETIKKLENKNNELTFDIQRLIYLTDQNKGELLNTIKKMKLEKNDLINKIHTLTSKLIEKDNIIEKINIEKNEIINNNLILKNKYENEIKTLNCEMNNYKLKLNYITLEYQNILENFHKLKQEVIFEQKKDLKKFILEENKSDSLNLLNINNNTNNNYNQIDNSFTLNNIKNKEFTKNVNKNNLSKSSKKNNILNNSKYSSNSFDKSKTPKIKNNLKNKRFLHKKKLNSNNLTQSSLKSNNSHKINSEPNNNFFNDEILNLEKKLAQLNISYQTYLKEIQNFPNQNYKENKELKTTLNFLENSIKETNEKLEKLKEKQQILIIHSKSNK